MRYETEYERKNREAAEAQFKKMRYEEGFRKTALPYIEQGKTFLDLAKDYSVTEKDEALYNQIAEEVKHQKALDEAFLKGLQWDNMPMQKKDTTKTVIS